MGANKSSTTKDINEPSSITLEDTLEQRRIHIQMLRNVLLICLHENNNTDDQNRKWRQTIPELQRAVSNIMIFSDSDQCIEFIKTINDNKVCMIISGSLGQEIVSRIHDMSQIDSILIFSDNKQDDEKWSNASSKVKGIFTDIPLICEALRQAAHQCEQNFMPLSFIPSNNKKFDQLDLSFIYTKILKEIILTSNFEENHIKEFIGYCRELFADSKEELVHIKAFESKYRSESPIWWYTYDCFLRLMLNRALRMMNGNIITRMSFFIADLHQQIEQLHREQYTGQSSSAIFTVYYGQGILKTDFEQLKKSQRGLISFNNFLLTSKNSKLSLKFAQDAATKDDLVGTMFIIKIDPSQSNTEFASIQNVSHSKTEDEVLFSINTIFRINDIKRLTANNRLQEVHLTLTTDKDKELTTLTNHIRQESFEDKEGWHRLGAVLLKLNHFDQAEQIYQVLRSQTTESSKSAIIFDQLGSIKDKQEKYSEAIPFYEQSLTIYQETPPDDHLHVANIYYSIGIAYSKTGSNLQALPCHIESLKIREQLLPTDHPDLAKSYGTIASLYASMNDYQAAVSYFEKELQINQKALPANHPQLATSYMNIGMMFFNTENYPKALSYYEKVLEIQQKTVPTNYRDLAKIYNNMGAVYNSLSDFEKALSFHEKALAIREKILPRNHPDFGSSFNNMGVTYENMKNYPKACSYFERAIEVGEHSLPSNHPILEVRRENLERVKEKT